MFDKTYVQPTREVTRHVNQSTTIHEHRAPTDKSVALLGEMEHAAEQKILDRVLLKSNECGIEAFAVVFTPDSYHHVVKAKVIINGTKHYIEEEFDPTRSQKHEVINKVAEGIANKLTMELMRKALVGMARSFNG